MDFEYDSNKSESNRKRHGIDFIQAQKLWSDLDRVEIPAKTVDENRTMVIGKIGTKHWSAVITYRGEKARLISARRSRKEEIEIYESEGV
jgi:uncharacterized DUF497 family protein